VLLAFYQVIEGVLKGYGLNFMNVQTPYNHF